MPCVKPALAYTSRRHIVHCPRHVTFTLHIQPVEHLGLFPLVLDDLQHLVLGLGIRQARHADVGHQVPGDLPRVEGVLPADPERSRGGLGLEPPRAHDGVVQARRPQVVLCDDLLVEDAPEGVGDDEAGALLLASRAAVGEDGGDHDHLLDVGSLGGVDEAAGAEVVDLVGGGAHLEGVAGDEAHGDDEGLGAGEGGREDFGGVGDCGSGRRWRRGGTGAQRRKTAVRRRVHVCCNVPHYIDHPNRQQETLFLVNRIVLATKDSIPLSLLHKLEHLLHKLSHLQFWTRFNTFDVLTRLSLLSQESKKLTF